MTASVSRVPGVAGLRFCDEVGDDVVLDQTDADILWRITDGLEAATVSACQSCRSRVVAAMALVDLLDASPTHRAGGALCELADGAPTAHLYVVDLAAVCGHRTWLDPLAEEWAEMVDGPSRGPVH
jgi:hypothetical protein